MISEDNLEDEYGNIPETSEVHVSERLGPHRSAQNSMVPRLNMAPVDEVHQGGSIWDDIESTPHAGTSAVHNIHEEEKATAEKVDLESDNPENWQDAFQQIRNR